jgi:hypothetical protein
MIRRKLIPALTLATGLLAGAAVSASAHEGDPHPSPPPSATGEATYLVARMTGDQEVPSANTGPKVGDTDGKAVTYLRIRGNQVSFATKWANIAAPTAGHTHAGVAGQNGPVKIGFFGALPSTARAVTGSVTVADEALLDSLKTSPESFYANLHTAEFPGGAVRGQFEKSDPVDLNKVLRNGPLAALADGDQEVTGGDVDGSATAFVKASGSKVTYSLKWNGTASPTAGHIHSGKAGVNGPVAVPFFAAPDGLGQSITGIAGVVKDLDFDTVKGIRQHPSNYYVNIHNAEFPGGAVRGQLFRAG